METQKSLNNQNNLEEELEVSGTLTKDCIAMLQLSKQYDMGRKTGTQSSVTE